MRLIPKNWETFQHYKDRCPPWIKLHRDLLNDRAFMRLPTASKALAPMLWLLASESKDGEFDGSIEELEFRLRMPEREVIVGLKALIDNGFFLVASGALADCLLDAIPETETEGETEGEAKTEKEGEKRLRASTLVAIDTPLQATCRDTWESYAAAYADRYHTAPLRNAKVNSLIKRFCQMVPAAEAASIAAHYVRHNGQYYVAKLHPVDLLLADAAKLRTEWATGMRMTTTRARQMDRTGSMLDMVAEIKRERGEA